MARRGTSPGVIVVSAENPEAPSELRQRAPMRYIPSALLNDNLYRHVYLRYGTEQILETTLQLDDQGNPKVPVHARAADDRLERRKGDGGGDRRSGDRRDASACRAPTSAASRAG